MRIIAGAARGRKLEAPAGMDTRPTLDRVKEAVFGMLQFDIPGSDVLDLFAGSGGMGLEAVSRGANRAVLNDRDGGCAAIIRRNAASCGLSDRVEVMQAEYAACIERLRASGRRFDFVFIDAPYRDGTGQRAAELAYDAGLLKPGGRILLEHAADLPPAEEPARFLEIKRRTYGKCAVILWKGRADE